MSKSPRVADVDVVRSLVDYLPDDGRFYWKAREGSRGKGWNSGWVGKEAGSLAPSGYMTIALFNRNYQAHRLAWAIHYGVWPTHQIDHINGDRSDNRIANLREATNTENRRNARQRANNRSGFKGVSWCPYGRNWRAQIGADGKRIKLGRFSTKEAAHSAYCLAAIELHGEFANSGKGPL